MRKGEVISGKNLFSKKGQVGVFQISVLIISIVAFAWMVGSLFGEVRGMPGTAELDETEANRAQMIQNSNAALLGNATSLEGLGTITEEQWKNVDQKILNEAMEMKDSQLKDFLNKPENKVQRAAVSKNLVGEDVVNAENPPKIQSVEKGFVTFENKADGHTLKVPQGRKTDKGVTKSDSIKNWKNIKSTENGFEIEVGDGGGEVTLEGSAEVDADGNFKLGKDSVLDVSKLDDSSQFLGADKKITTAGVATIKTKEIPNGVKFGKSSELSLGKGFVDVTKGTWSPSGGKDFSVPKNGKVRIGGDLNGLGANDVGVQIKDGLIDRFNVGNQVKDGYKIYPGEGVYTEKFLRNSKGNLRGFDSKGNILFGAKNGNLETIHYTEKGLGRKTKSEAGFAQFMKESGFEGKVPMDSRRELNLDNGNILDSGTGKKIGQVDVPNGESSADKEGGKTFMEKYGWMIVTGVLGVGALAVLCRTLNGKDEDDKDKDKDKDKDDDKKDDGNSTEESEGDRPQADENEGGDGEGNSGDDEGSS